MIINKGSTRTEYQSNSNGERIMSVEELTKIINKLQNDIPQLQQQLQQALGYRQCLLDQQKETEESDAEEDEAA